MKIVVETTVHAPSDAVWSAWTTPADIIRWNAPSDDWHTTAATVDLRVGGRQTARMEAKDGSFGFDFDGTYTEIVDGELIVFELEDGREVRVDFEPAADGNAVTVRETFDAETENDPEMQREGWQAILDSFGRYVER